MPANPDIYPIDLKHKDKWIAYTSDDARAYSDALIVAGIDFQCTFVWISRTLSIWTFTRIIDGSAR